MSAASNLRMRKKKGEMQPRIRRRLQKLVLLIAVAHAGLLLCKLYYNGQSSRESRPTSRWKLFGDAFISDEERTQPGVQRLSVEQGEQLRLLADSLLIRSGDVAVKELVRGLESSQVYCHTYPENEGVIQRKYAKFLEVLAIYTAFHKQERNGEGTKRLIWICDVYKACRGLADRVKGVTYALILAMLSQRVLILDWRNSQFGEQSFLQPNTIDWRLSEEDQNVAYLDANAAYEKNPEDQDYQMLEQSDSGPIDLHIFSVLGGIGVDISVDDLQMSLEFIKGKWQWIQLASNMEPSSLLNDTKTASSQWIKQGMAALGLAKLPPDDVDGLAGLVFRYLFKFSGQLLAELGAARQVLGLDNQQYVGVHIHTGFAGSVRQESVEHPKLFHGAWQWDKTLSCAHRHATELLGSSALLFLATDSNLVKNKTLDTQRYRGRFRSLDNSVVHLEKFPHDVKEFETEGIMTAWIDLVLLSESYSLVRGESGFPFLAQSLCFIPRTKVINGLGCHPWKE